MPKSRRAPAANKKKAALAAKAAKKKTVGAPSEADAVAAASDADEAGVLGETTNIAAADTSATAATDAGPSLIFSISNNTMRLNREVETRQRAATTAAATVKAALRAENMRLHNPDGERPLVILPALRKTSRIRTSTKRADASPPKPKAVLTRAQVVAIQNAPSENALLERTAKKRAASGPAGAAAKKSVFLEMGFGTGADWHLGLKDSA